MHDGPWALTAAAGLGRLREVRWEERLLEVFDDLEQEAEGLALQARDAVAAERARELYSEVDLASRLHGSVGAVVELLVPGAGPVQGRLVRAGRDWCLVADGATGHEWVVNLSGLLCVRGLASRAAAERVRPVTSRLGIASALRRLAAEPEPVVVTRSDGVVRRGRLLRVGSDFVELAAETGGSEVLPVGALAVLRRG